MRFTFAKNIMSRRIITIAAILLITVVFAAFKLVYLGWKYDDFGQVGEYRIMAYQTMHDPNPLALRANDADGGYYRIMDKDGRKVVEIFSKHFAFDVVIPSEDQVEFQLLGGTLIWKTP